MSGKWRTLAANRRLCSIESPNIRLLEQKVHLESVIATVAIFINGCNDAQGQC